MAGKLEEGVNRIDRTVERITITIEEEANDMVSYYLRQRGINIEASPVRLNSVYEFNVYGTNGQYTIVSEAKTRASKILVRLVR